MWYTRFFKQPSWVCFNEDGGAGTAGGGEGSGGADPDGQGGAGEGAGSQQTGGAGEGATGGVSNEAASATIRAEKAKIKAQYADHEAVVSHLTKVTGLTPTQIRQKLENQIQQPFGGQAVQPPAGMSPELFQTFTNMAGALKHTEQETKRLKRDFERGQIKTNPKYADYDQVAKDVEDYADKFGVSLEQAYWAVNGANRAEQLAREAEQRAIATREQNWSLGVVSGGGSAIGTGGGKFDNQDQAYVASQFGMDADEFKALSGEKVNIDDFDRFHKKKNQKR